PPPLAVVPVTRHTTGNKHGVEIVVCVCERYKLPIRPCLKGVVENIYLLSLATITGDTAMTISGASILAGEQHHNTK
ncbi:MAG TPA: hypothetical protein V6D30_19750, partial [Leptolyngbyaceae cyanobacterium]